MEQDKHYPGETIRKKCQTKNGKTKLETFELIARLATFRNWEIWTAYRIPGKKYTVISLNK